ALGVAAAGDPLVNIARAPIVAGERVGPVAVAAVHLRQVGAAELTVLAQIEAVAAADVDGGRGADLHRPLRPQRLGPPHAQIAAMPRFDAVDGEGDAVELA